MNSLSMSKLQKGRNEDVEFIESAGISLPAQGPSGRHGYQKQIIIRIKNKSISEEGRMDGRTNGRPSRKQGSQGGREGGREGGKEGRKEGRRKAGKVDWGASSA